MNDAHKQNSIVTLEVILYAILLCVGFVFRLGALGQKGLSDHEAKYALQAYRLSVNESTGISGEPGYLGMATGLFKITDANNFTSRIFSGVFGTLLILVPALFRKYLGKVPALVLATFLVFDPGMISLSRTAASSMMGITCFFAGVGFLINRRQILASLSWGFFLSAGTSIWIGALVFLIIFFAFKSESDKDRERLQINWLELIVPGAVLFVVVTTQFMATPRGISGFGTSFVEYIQSWKQTPQVTLGLFIIEVILLQLPMLVIGFVGIVRGIIKKDKIVLFLATWWGLALISILVNPSRNPLQLGWVTLPLLTIAAITITNFFAKVRFDNPWIGFGQIVFSFLMFAVTFLYLLNITNFPELDPILYRNKLLAVFLPLILLAAITGLFTWGWSSQSAKSGLLISLITLGVVVFLSSGWNATHWTSSSSLNLWKTEYSITGERLLINELNDLAKWTSGQTNTLDIEVSGLELPSLEWSLRNFDTVSNSSQVNKNTTSEVIITSLSSSFEPGASYRGQLVKWAQRPDVSVFTVWDWIKWLIYKDSPVQTQDIIVWVRNDLFKGVAP